MASAAAPVSILATVSIDRNSRIPLYVQLCTAMRARIEARSLADGFKMPAEAAIAELLGIPKNTVRRALHKLAEEGLLQGSSSSGYRVVADQPATSKAGVSLARDDHREAVQRELPMAPHVVPPTPSPVDPSAKTFSFNRVSILDDIDFSRLHSAGAPRPFRPGFPETQEFPLEIWEGLRAQLLKERASELLDFCGTFGHLPLRDAVAARLRDARGVRCSAEQVIICSGAQQALNLVINTLVSPGDSVGMEEPGYYGVKAAFMQAGAKVVPLLVDDEGLTVPDARRQNPPLLIYTTPANQFPLGAALSLPRRLALLEFARQTGTWIIEDDSDGDFAYAGRPLPSLQAIDQQSRVIYFGTSGKTLFPSLEIGYIVVPLSLMESFAKTKEIMGGQPCVIDQAVLARFIGDGHFDRHLHRMSILYMQRLQALKESVNSELKGFIDLEPPKAGLHAVGWLARGLDEEFVKNSAAQAAVELPLISTYGRTALVRPGVLFGFASYGEQKIRETIQRLAQALRSPEKRPALPAPQAPESAKSGLFRRFLYNRFGRI
jgi:GntR family transcriptional regulator/MocR family aminotransferase